MTTDNRATRPIAALVAVTALLVPASATLADDWPQWRGPQRNSVSREKGLLKQ